MAHSADGAAVSPPLIRVLIVDQFSGLGPLALAHSHPLQFEDLVTQMLSAAAPAYGPAPRVDYVPEDYRPALCTTIIRAGSNGLAEVWKYRWDSSG